MVGSVAVATMLLLAIHRPSPVAGAEDEGAPPELTVSGGCATWTVESGSCETDGGCITSPNYPNHYGSSQSCSMRPSAAGELSCEAFDTQGGYDHLDVGGHSYSGHGGISDCPDGIAVDAGDEVRWHTDGSVTHSGFRICLGTGGGGGGVSNGGGGTYHLLDETHADRAQYGTVDGNFRIYWEAPQWVLVDTSQPGIDIVHAGITSDASLPPVEEEWTCSAELFGSSARNLTVTARTCGALAQEAAVDCTAPTCEDSATWEGCCGGCSTYAPGRTNHNYCDEDSRNGLHAYEACPVSCGRCESIPGAEEPAAVTNCSVVCAEHMLPVAQHCGGAVESLSSGLEDRCRSAQDAALADSPQAILVSGACADQAEYNGEYTLQPLTYNGRPLYISTTGLWIVWATSRWRLRTSPTGNGVQESDGYTDSPDLLGQHVWRLECSGYSTTSVVLTVSVPVSRDECTQLANEVADMSMCQSGCSLECAAHLLPAVARCSAHLDTFSQSTIDACRETVHDSAQPALKLEGSCYGVTWDDELLLQPDPINGRPSYATGSTGGELSWDGGDQFSDGGGRWSISQGTAWINATTILPPIGEALTVRCMSSGGSSMHQGQASLIEWTCDAMAQELLSGPACAIRDAAGADAWTIESGSCEADGGCITSPNYPNHYGNSQSCSMRPSAAGELSCEAFDTEGGYDHLDVGGHSYSGHGGISDCPDGIAVDAGDEVRWHTDGSVTYSGFRICLGSTRYHDTSDCSLRCAEAALPVVSRCTGSLESFPVGFPDTCQAAVDSVVDAAAPVLRVLGSCDELIGADGDYQLQSGLLDRHVHYVQGGFSLYWSNSRDRWQISSSESSHDYVAYLADDASAVGEHQWRMRCPYSFRDATLTIAEPLTE
eukprot:COSAG06_NODE_2755_length_6337_cov_7.492145_6_plen_886_part_01